MTLYIEKIKMFEAPEAAYMEKHDDAHHLAFGHFWGPFGRLP
jgi:hypothetical protein